MQLTELIKALADEARSSRDELLECARLLVTFGEEGPTGPALALAATTYSDFCGRLSAAVGSLGLEGLTSVALSIRDGLEMASGLPVELRESAGPLLSLWPEFCVHYLENWGENSVDQEEVFTLLACITQAEYLTPLNEEQLHGLQQQLSTPPSRSSQQAEMVPVFQPPDSRAMSLELPQDAEASVVDDFLAEGPELVQRLAALVTGFETSPATAAQLELAHRTAHTLKGNAAMAGVRGIATLAHALEDVLEVFRQDDFSAPPGVMRALGAGCDQMDLAMEHLIHKTGQPGEFQQVTRALHAWAAHLQGLDVPAGELSLQAMYGVPAPGQAGVCVPAQASAPSEPGEPGMPTAATETPPGEAAAQEEEAQIRVPAKALDRIFRAVNELSIGLLRLRNQNDEVLRRTDAMAALEQVANLRLADIERQVTLDGLGRVHAAPGSDARLPGLGTPKAGAEFDSLELDRYNELTGAAQALNESIVDIRAARQELLAPMREASTLLQRQLDFAKEAQYQIAQARLRPLSDLRARLRRIVRQTSQSAGRDVALEIVGDELRVDAAVLGPLSEALLHLLRNSVDHGIEPPQERVAKGKPAQGAVKVEFTALGSGVSVRITDDGAGLDYEGILDKASWSPTPNSRASRSGG
jgi:HPt (histidine-containing phosphotransfer) domain-containing protein